MGEGLDGITREQFEAFRDVRRGRSNPERMNNPFWEAMVRSRWDGYYAGEHFKAKQGIRNSRPIWCFARRGTSQTLLPDGKVVLVAGAYFDPSDPNYAVYNDVIVKDWNSNLDIYGYPVSDFPPVDFHTTTPVGEGLYVVGGRGCDEDRVVGTTPVFRLDLESMEIHRLEVKGEEPGWIYGHEAVWWAAEQSVLIWGGEIFRCQSHSTPNKAMWAFDVYAHTWRRLESVCFGQVDERN
jgi:hypothetical protein